MAKDKESMEFERLNEMLRNSFEGIRTDADNIKSAIRDQSVDVNSLRSEIEGLKSDFVTADKFNILKIKVSELLEEVKRVSKLEKGLARFDTDALTKEGFERERERIFAKLEDLRNEIILVDRISKAAISEVQLKKLIAELNAEFDKVKNDITGIEARGGKVVQDRIENFKKEFNKRALLLSENVKGTTDNFVKNINDKIKESEKNIETKVNDLREEVKSAVKVYTKDTNQNMVNLNAEVNKRLLDLNSSVKSNTQGFTKDLKDRMDSLEKEAQQQINVIKDVLQKRQVDLEDKINKRVENIESNVKGALNQFAAEYSNNSSAFTKRLKAMLDETNKRLTKINKESAHFVTRSQADTLIKDINVEFDSVKERLEDIERLKEEIKSLRKNMISTTYFNDQIGKVNDNFEKMRGEIKQSEKADEEDLKDIEDLKSDVARLRRESVSKNYFQQQVDDIHSAMANLSGDMRSLAKAVRQSAKENPTINGQLAEETSKLKTEMARLEKSAKKISPKQPEILTKGEIQHPKLNILSHILIGLAFASIIGAIATYFINTPDILKYGLIGGAVVVFVIGIALRLFVVLKR